MKLKQKKLIIMFSITALVLASITIYFTIIKSLNLSADKLPLATQKNSTSDITKTYISEFDGYSIQYPYFFKLDDSRPDYVRLVNTTCEDYEKLCIAGIDVITIYSSDNTDAVNTDQYYQSRIADVYYLDKKDYCQKIKILPLGYHNVDESQYLEAIRCRFDAVPKQAKGGYAYEIVKGNKIFHVEMYQGSMRSFSDPFYNLPGGDYYDPLGDMMMQTFRFTK